MLYRDMVKEQKIIRRELARRERILSKPNGQIKLAREDAKLDRSFARVEAFYEFLHELGESPLRVLLMFIAAFSLAFASPLIIINFVLPFLNNVIDLFAAIPRI